MRSVDVVVSTVLLLVPACGGESGGDSPDAAAAAPAWAASAGGDGWDLANDVALTSGGSVVAAGGFAGAVQFRGGDGAAMAVAPIVDGADEVADGFVARWSAAGELAWVRRIGGPADSGGDRDVATAVAASGDGVVVAGELDGRTTFDDPTAPRTADGRGGIDAYAAAYDAGGRLQWIATAGGAGDDEAWSVAAMPDGGAVIAGRFQGDARFGAGEPAETTLHAAGGTDGFVARFGGDGALRWARAIGGPNDDVVVAAATAGGDVLVAGSFFGEVRFPDGTALHAPVAIDSDLLLARFDRDGQLVWARRDGGEGMDTTRRLAVTADGDLVVAASFAGTTIAGAGDPGARTLTSRGLDDIDLARYDGAGHLRWARQLGGAGNDLAWAVAVDERGTAWLGGTIESRAGEAIDVIADDGGGGARLTVGAASAALIAGYDRDGGLVRLDQAGGQPGDRAEARGTAAAAGRVVAAGGFAGDASFTGVTGASGVRTGAGGRDAFVASWPAP